MTTTTRNVAIAAALIAIVAALFVATRSPSSPSPAEMSAANPKEEHDDTNEVKRVTLTRAAFATAQIRVEAVRVGSAAVTSPGLDIPAQVEFDPRRVAVVSPRVDARIEQLTVVEGDRVAAGHAVAALNSKDFLVAQSDVRQAARRAHLLSGGPDAAGAQALVEAARRRLSLLGVQDGEITRLESGGEPPLFLPVVAPIGGSIMKVHLLAGQSVRAGDPIFTIADLTVVDVIAEVPEQSLSMVRVGQSAQVSLAAFPSTPFAGTVERLRDELNPETRTVKAVIHVTNSSGRLRPGMFASVRLAVPSTAFPDVRRSDATRNESLLTIPESAVVTDGDKRYVFVQVAPMTYERRAVHVAPLAPPGSSVVNTTFVLVRGGLAAGEMVVTRGAFTLKSELAKAGLGEHGH